MVVSETAIRHCVGDNGAILKAASRPSSWYVMHSLELRVHHDRRETGSNRIGKVLVKICRKWPVSEDTVARGSWLDCPQISKRLLGLKLRNVLQVASACFVPMTLKPTQPVEDVVLYGHHSKSSSVPK